jgi:hypothetical protein
LTLPRAFYLPVAIREALAPGDVKLSVIPASDRLLWQQQHPGESVYFAARSRTHVDVGWWFIGRRLSVLAGDSGLFLVAAGPRPVCEFIPYGALNKSLYNHAIGCVVLAPFEWSVTRVLRLPLRIAEQLLAQIYRKELDYA